MFIKRIPEWDSIIMVENRRLHWLERSSKRALPRRGSAKYRAAMRDRSPVWADRAAIAEVYTEVRDLEALTGIRFHVDHVLPLRGVSVSGLHVAANLQIITVSENCSKQNSYDINYDIN